MNILIPGGLGYVGSHLTVELLNRDNTVIILDNCFNSTENTLLKINCLTGTNPIFFNGCVSDYSLVSKICSLYAIDLVVYCVSPHSIFKCEFNPKLCQETFVTPTTTFFTNVKLFGLNRFVYFSSNLDGVIFAKYKRMIEPFLINLNHDNDLNVNIIQHAYPFSTNFNGLLETNTTERLDWVEKEKVKFINIEKLIEFYFSAYNEPGFNIFNI